MSLHLIKIVVKSPQRQIFVNQLTFVYKIDPGLGGVVEFGPDYWHREGYILWVASYRRVIKKLILRRISRLGSRS